MVVHPHALAGGGGDSFGRLAVDVPIWFYDMDVRSDNAEGDRSHTHAGSECETTLDQGVESSDFGLSDSTPQH